MLQQYLEELRKNPLLTRDEEQELWRLRAAGDETAHSRLITSYQPLVFKLAMAFRLPEALSMELIQEGTVGLLEAAEAYDYTKGVAFSLFASHRIRGRMCDFLTKETQNRNISLDYENEQGYTLADFIPSNRLTPAEVAERHVVADKVSGAVERLPLKEQQVLRGVFLENKTIGDIASLIEVSPSHVYRLQKKGVQRIRGMLSRFMRDFNKD